MMNASLSQQTGENVASLLEYIYLQFEVGEAQGIRSWCDLFDEYFQNHKFELCAQMLQEVKTYYSRLCMSCQARIRFAEGELSQQRNKWLTAKRNYVESLRLRHTLALRAKENVCQSKIAGHETDLTKDEVLVAIRNADMAQCWHQLGKLYSDQGQLNKAERYYRRAVALRNEIDSKQGLALSLIGLGGIYRVLGKYRDAKKCMEDALSISEETRDHVNAAARHELRNIWVQQRNTAEARREFESGSAAGEEKEKTLSNQVAASHHQLGVVYEMDSKYAEALQEFESAIAIERESKDEMGKAATLHQMGMIDHTRGDYTQAQRQYAQALKIRQDLGDKTGQAQTLHQLGMLCQDQGNYAEAGKLFTCSLVLVQEIGDRAGETWTLYQLGTICQKLGRIDEARKRYEASKAIAQDTGDRVGFAMALHQLGGIYLGEENYVDTRRLFEEALTIWREIGDKVGESQTLHQVGILAQIQGHYVESKKWYEASLAIEQSIGNQAGIVASLCQLGSLHQVRGDLDGARQRYEEALICWRQGRSANELSPNAGMCVAVGLRELGSAYRLHGKYDEARRRYEDAVSIWQTLGDQLGEAQTLFQIGVSHQEQGDLEQACSLYERSLLIIEEASYKGQADKADVARLACQLGMIWETLGNFAKATSFLQRALTFAQEIESPDEKEIQHQLDKLLEKVVM